MLTSFEQVNIKKIQIVFLIAFKKESLIILNDNIHFHIERLVKDTITITETYQ